MYFAPETKRYYMQKQDTVLAPREWKLLWLRIASVRPPLRVFPHCVILAYILINRIRMVPDVGTMRNPPTVLFCLLELNDTAAGTKDRDHDEPASCQSI